MWLALICLTLAAPPEFAATAADGSQHTGALVAMSAQQVELAGKDGPITLPTSQLMSLAPTSSPLANSLEAAVWVELVDGAKLVGKRITTSGKTAKLEFGNGEFLELATTQLATVRFRTQNAAQAEQWADILKAERTGDLIVLRKDETLDYLSGIVGDIGEETVEFNLDGEPVPVKLTRVEGLIWFHPAGHNFARPITTVVDARGNQWPATGAKVDGESLRLTTPSGLETALPLATIREFRFQSQYVSDLAAERETWTPWFPAAALPDAIRAYHAPRRDRNADGGPLRLGGVTYNKGLGLRSRTEIVFRLPEAYRLFTCTAGIDDAVRPHGKVQLVILGDDRVLLDTTLSGNDEPRPISLDISGVARLKFVVDFGDGLPTADHLNLCDARVFP